MVRTEPRPVFGFLGILEEIMLRQVSTLDVRLQLAESSGQYLTRSKQSTFDAYSPILYGSGQHLAGRALQV